MLVQEFLRFVDLGRQVRAPTAIGVVKEHELTVLLADLVFVQRAFPIRRVSDLVREQAGFHLGGSRRHTAIPGSRRLRDGSSGVRIRCPPVSNPIASHRVVPINLPLVEGLARSIHTSLVATKGNIASATLL